MSKSPFKKIIISKFENPIRLSHKSTFIKKKTINLDQSIINRINEITTEEFTENFSEILIISKDIFLNKIIREVELILTELYPNYKNKIKDLIEISKQNLEEKYSKNYAILNNEWKKYQNKQKTYNYLSHYIKHCIHTEKFAYHLCKNRQSKLIEIYNNKKEVSHLICTECKKCYLSNEILLYCNYCSLEYYSRILSKNEDINILPATWEKYHCGGMINNTMKCIKCQNILYLNLKDNYLICLNPKCQFKTKPENIIWNCAICKNEFKSNAKIYNYLEISLIKRLIKKILLFKEKAYPNEIPCCKVESKKLIFFHKEDCKGELYKGMLYNHKIIVCSKCHAMNFFDKFIWTCPLCYKKFKSYKSAFNSIFKKKEYIVINNTSNSLSPGKNIKIKEKFMSPINFGKSVGFTSVNSYYSKNNDENTPVKSNRNNSNKMNKSYDTNKIVSLMYKSYPKRQGRRYLYDILQHRNNSNSKEKDKLNKSNNIISITTKKKNSIINSVDIQNQNNIDIQKDNNENKGNKIVSVDENQQDNNIDNTIVNKNNNNNNNNNNIFNKKNNHDNLNKKNSINNLNKNNNNNNFNENNEENIVENNKEINNKNNKDNIYENNKANNKETKENNINNEVENNNAPTNDNSSLGNTSNQPTRKINRIKLNLNETTEKSNKTKNEEEEEDSFSFSGELKTHKTNKSNKTKTIMTKQNTRYIDEELEKEEEMDKINDLDEHNFFILNKRQSLIFSPNNKKFDKLDSLIKFNNERRGSQISLGELSSNSEIPINLGGNILTNPEKLKLISQEGLIPEFEIDDFEYLNPIGEGSYGKIYSVENIYDESRYALKKIICHDLKEVKLIQSNLELIYSKQHEHIMKIIGVEYKCLDITTYSLYILMELALSDWNDEIKRRFKEKKYYTENEIIDIIKQIIKPLIYLENEGIAHRDIKPQNILIFENNIYKITDFGEMKILSDSVQESTLRGSQLYMSPVLYNGLKYNQRDVIHNAYKSDVYSFGFCLIYALTLNINILSDLRDIISMKVLSSMISKNIKKYYSSKMIYLITKMLELDERERFSFQDVEKYIKENYC